MTGKIASPIWALGAQGNPDCAALSILSPRQGPTEVPDAMTGGAKIGGQVHGCVPLCGTLVCPNFKSLIFREMVEPRGIEPLTSCMPCKRSPS